MSIELATLIAQFETLQKQHNISKMIFFIGLWFGFAFYVDA